MRLAAFLPAAFLCLAACDNPNWSTSKPVAEIGRYQIIASDAGSFLLDTATGDTWRYGRIMMKNGDLWDKGWFEETRQSEIESQNTFRRLERHEAAQSEGMGLQR